MARKVWAEYSQEVHAVIYMVDAVDRGRFAEAKAELHGLCEIDDLRGVRLPSRNLAGSAGFFWEGLGVTGPAKIHDIVSYTFKVHSFLHTSIGK